METELNGLLCRLLSAFHPSALYHLRASDFVSSVVSNRPSHSHQTGFDT